MEDNSHKNNGRPPMKHLSVIDTKNAVNGGGQTEFKIQPMSPNALAHKRTEIGGSMVKKAPSIIQTNFLNLNPITTKQSSYNSPLLSKNHNFQSENKQNSLSGVCDDNKSSHTSAAQIDGEGQYLLEKTKQELDDTIKDLDCKLNRVLMKQEYDYLKGYNIYVKRKEKELRDLIQKLSDRNNSQNMNGNGGNYKDDKMSSMEQ